MRLLPKNNEDLAKALIDADYKNLTFLDKVFMFGNPQDFFNKLTIIEEDIPFITTPIIREIISVPEFEYKVNTLIIYKIGTFYFISTPEPTIYHRSVGKDDTLVRGEQLTFPNNCKELYVISCTKRCVKHCQATYRADVYKYTKKNK